MNTPKPNKDGQIDYVLHTDATANTEPITSGLRSDSDVLDNPQPQPNELSLAGRFVLTGVFRFASREAISNIITKNGGQCTKHVVAATQYVAVGSMATKGWIAGNKGTKIQAALEARQTRKNGWPKIISEETLLAVFELNGLTDFQANRTLRTEKADRFIRHVAKRAKII